MYHASRAVRQTPLFFTVPPWQIAGSDLVVPDIRRQVGQTILALQTGNHPAGDGVPLDSFTAVAEGLGAERRSWLDAAAAEFTALSQQG